VGAIEGEGCRSSRDRFVPWIGGTRPQPGTLVAPAKNQQLCVLASAAQATDQGIQQKVVLLRVDAIAADGTLNLTVTAWSVLRLSLRGRD
jgi:hypothetical protein